MHVYDRRKLLKKKKSSKTDRIEGILLQCMLADYLPKGRNFIYYKLEAIQPI